MLFALVCVFRRPTLSGFGRKKDSRKGLLGLLGLFCCGINFWNMEVRGAAGIGFANGDENGFPFACCDCCGRDGDIERNGEEVPGW